MSDLDEIIMSHTTSANMKIGEELLSETSAEKDGTCVKELRATTVPVEIKILNKTLEFNEGDSCKLVEHAIRSQNNISGGGLSKDDKIYFGSTLFLPGTYVFIGGKVCQSPGEGWVKKKGAKCPCC